MCVCVCVCVCVCFVCMCLFCFVCLCVCVCVCVGGGGLGFFGVVFLKINDMHNYKKHENLPSTNYVVCSIWTCGVNYQGRSYVY